MPAEQGTINLLEQEGSTNSPWNRIMVWITTYGRYIMVTTELIVLIAFASRFSLDRKLSDLKENILEKQEILEANVDLEKEIRGTQEKISAIKLLVRGQTIPIETLLAIHTLLPTGTYLETLSIDKDKITTNMIADSSDSFSKLLANFSVTKKLTGVEIGKIGKKPAGLQFTVSAKIQTLPGEEKK
jgi:Tfp pilus assembly protein PilN